MVISQELILRFLFSNTVIVLITFMLLLFKGIVRKQISAGGQYQIWILYLFMLTIPFLPVRNRLFSLTGFLGILSSNTARAAGTFSAAAAPAVNNMQIQDYAMEAEKAGLDALAFLLSAVWVLGACIMLWYIIRSAQKLHCLFKSALPVQNEDVCSLYEKCLTQCGTKREIRLMASAFIRTPVSFGVFCPCVILPTELLSENDRKELKYILLHEIQHCRRRDHTINLIMNLFCIVYWFNPAVWYAWKKMRQDRELACDASVLGILREDCYREYGSALLKHASKISHPPYSMTTGFAGNGKQMKKRILGIVTYHRETKSTRMKNTAFLFLSAVLVLGSSPFLSVAALGASSSSSPDGRTRTLELGAFFDDYTGSFVLYQPSLDTWSIWGEEKSRMRVSPNSTYKIYSALLALEKGTITPDASLLPWDEKAYPFESWNQDQDLDSAMKNSVNWYFQELDRKAGLSSIQDFLDQIDYGNKNISGGPDTFWMESSLKISPIEQVRLMADFYNNAFGFRDSSVQAVKDSMCITKEDGYALYGKTGTGNLEGKDVNGWFTGYVETLGVPSFFAVNIQGEDHADGTAASQIALDVLAQMNLMPKQR